MNNTQSIRITKTKNTRISELDPEHIHFGNVFSDHMFVMDYANGEWQAPAIVPYGPLELSPAVSALHYGQAIFEGLKAYKTSSGEIELFRPMENFKRFNKSAVRLCMPEIPEALFFEGLKELLKLDQQWILTAPGCSLYIRPYMFANDHYLGVRTALNYKFIIITSPAGAYFSEPLKVVVEQKFVRAAEGGMGFAKAAGNYGVAIYPTKLAQEKGYHQIIWTDSKEHKYIEELGMMNFMCVINDTLITPGLEANSILHGVTRDSILTIAKDWGMPVEERKVSVDEVIQGIEKGTLKEVFGVGTAATVANIETIGYAGKDYQLPKVSANAFSTKAAQQLVDIRNGKVADIHNWVYKVQ
jgi:branched-chain amino acid aminotransferase